MKKKESFGSMKRRAEDREGWRIFVQRTCQKAEKLMMMNKIIFN
jgi:hypothetical protein